MFNFYNHRSAASSCAYNVQEQSRAIHSAEQQVLIANDTVKQVSSKLATRVDAMDSAVKGYFNRLNAIAASSEANHGPNPGTDGVASGAQLSKSTASSTSSSVSQILVSLKSGTNVIYSLVSKRPERRI